MRLYLDSCVLIYALDGAEQLRRHTLQQLEGYANADWVISDLVRMECLVGPLRTADQIRLLAFRSFFSDCSVVTLHPDVLERAAELRASTRLQTADAIHLAAAVYWGWDPSGLNAAMPHGNRKSERSPDGVPAAPQP